MLFVTCWQIFGRKSDCVDGRDWYKKGDWSNLLSEEQQIELGLKEAPKPAKPHIKLPLRNKTA